MFFCEGFKILGNKIGFAFLKVNEPTLLTVFSIEISAILNSNVYLKLINDYSHVSIVELTLRLLNATLRFIYIYVIAWL